MVLGPRVGPFRGLAPYGEDDASLLFGRDSESKQLVEMLRDSPTPVLVTGEVGVGKTSLLCAGLIPAARQRLGLLPIYLEAGSNWQRQFNEAFAQLAGRPATADEDPIAALGTLGKPLIICDHLEELLWLHADRIDAMAELLARLRAVDGARTVLVTDHGTSHALARLGERVAHVPEHRTLTLQRFERGRAAQVLEQAVLAGGGYMEAGLPESIAGEVCENGATLPADLQVVGHAAALRGATRHKAYSRAGGAEVLRTTYVERLAARAGGWRARRALAVIAEQPDPRARLTAEEIGERGGLPEGAALPLLAALQREGLVRGHIDLEPRRKSLSVSAIVPPPLSDEDSHAGSYSLLHPYLQQSVRDLCASVQRGRARAKLYLRQRIHGERKLRPHELVSVWRYLGEALSDKEREKIRKSLRFWIMLILGAFVLPFAVLGGLYVGNTTAQYVHVAPAISGVERVVLRAGRPSLAFAFGLSSRFGGVLLDSGVALSSLPTKTAKKVRARKLSGSLARAGSGELAPWLARVVAPMKPIRRGAWLLLAGDRAGGERVLLDAAGREATRKRATSVLATLSGNSKATLSALRLCVKDKRPAVRRMAVAEARRLGKAGLGVLNHATHDKDAQVRLEALVGLHALDRAAALKLLHERLRDIDARVQTRAFELLALAAKSDPRRAYVIMQRAAQGNRDPLTPIADKLLKLHQRILRLQPKAAIGVLTARLAAEKNVKRRLELLRWVIAISGKLDAKTMLPLARRLAKDGHPDVRSAAIALEARFASDAEATLERLIKLSKSYGYGRAAVAVRRAAAVGLGLLRGASRQKRVKALKRLLRDGSKRVRGPAASSLLRLGYAGQTAVLKVMKREMVIARAALKAVCSELEPNSRLAAVVLSSAWSTKKTELRAQALRCARTLAKASWRLSMWLADQAAVNDDARVRRAAAESVAVALDRRGRILRRIARRYLRDKDASVRAEVLRAIRRRPPKRPAFLFGYVKQLVGDEDARVRAATAPLLLVVARRSRQALPLLERLLRDKKRAVWRAALRALGGPRGKKLELDAAQKRSLGATLAHVVARARVEDALRALEVAKTLDLRAPAEQAARQPSPDVRAAAIAQLAPRAERKKALSVLESALRAPERRLRIAALSGLAEQSARLGEITATLIWRGTEARDPTERVTAFEMLARLKGKARARAVTLLLAASRHRSEERRQLAMRALGKLAPSDARAAKALVRGAVDPAIDVRSAAQAALARELLRRSSPDKLWTMLAGAARNSLLRRMVIAALAQPKEAVWLEKRASALPKGTPTVTTAAARLARALARRGDPPQPFIDWLYGW